MLSIKIFCFNDFSENTLIIHDHKNCLFVDPGCYTDAEFLELKTYVEKKQLHPISIINTHCHIDHVLGVERLKRHYKIPFFIGEHEGDTLRGVKLYAPAYGVQGYSEPEVDGVLIDNQIIELGDQVLKVVFVPGHSPGHIAFYYEEEHQIIAGDVLFKRSIGRTDLPGGDHDTLIESIRTRIFSLPDHTVVYPGHGPRTSVVEEKQFNPFCGERTGLI